VKKRILAILAIVGIIPLLAVSAINYYLASLNTSRDFDQIALGRTKEISLDVDAFLENHMNAVKTLARMPAVRSFDLAASKAQLIEFKKVYSNFFPITVDSSKGKQLVKDDNSALVDVSDRNFFLQAMAGKEDVISEVIISRSNNQPIIILATPIRATDNGPIVGVLQGAVLLTNLSEFVKQRSQDGNIAYIVDREGKILAHPDPNITKERRDLSDREYIKKGLAGNSGVEEAVGIDGKPVLVAYLPNPRTGWVVCMEMPREALLAKLSGLKYTAFVIAAITLLFIIGIGLYMARSVTKPISRLEKAAEIIGQGDMTVKVEVDDRTEIGRLAGYFNKMVGELRQLVQKVSRATTEVTDAAKQLAESAAQSGQTSATIARSITAVAEGADKQVASVKTAAQYADAIGADIKEAVEYTGRVAAKSMEAADAAKAGLEAVRTATGQMAKINATVGNSQQAVSHLGQRSTEIGQIIETISGIAGQTNLLALNAAIEAARAGEQGRGFAVVAEEVRKLAEQSQNATAHIAELIKEIQADTQNAVQAMDIGAEEVRQGNQMVEKAAELFAGIADGAEQLAQEIAQIGQMINKTAEVSRNILQAVDEVVKVSERTAAEAETVSAATEEQAAAMEQIAASSQHLSAMAEELRAIAQRFKI